MHHMTTDTPRRPRATRCALLCAMFVVVALALSGCQKSVSVSTKDHLDTRKAEKEISKSATRQLGEKVVVTCPSNVKLELGVVTVCQARTPNGQVLRVRMRQTDSAGNVTWTVIRDVDTNQLEPAIIRAGKARKLEITDASCPKNIEIQAGTKFTCLVVLRGQRRTLHVLITDDQGNVKFGEIDPAKTVDNASTSTTATTSG